MRLTKFIREVVVIGIVVAVTLLMLNWLFRTREGEWHLAVAPTSTPTKIPTMTPTATPTDTPQPTPTATAIPTATWTPWPTSTRRPSPTPKLYAVVDTDALNVRWGPGTDYDVMEVIKKSVGIEIIDMESEWIQIILPSKRAGWVYKPMVRTYTRQQITQYNKRISATTTAVARVTAMPNRSWAAKKDGITVAVGHFDYLLHTSYNGIYAPIGSKFIAFSATVYNDTESPIHANPNNFSLVDSTGRTSSYHNATYAYYGRPFPAVNVQPGGYTSGGIIFLIGYYDSPRKVIYESMFRPTIIVDLN